MWPHRYYERVKNNSYEFTKIYIDVVKFTVFARITQKMSYLSIEILIYYFKSNELA